MSPSRRENRFLTRGLKAPLSPHEEITLNRVGLGTPLEGELPAGDVARLRSLALVEEKAGRVHLTPSGRHRLDALRERPAARRAGASAGDGMSSELSTAFYKARQ
jgi:hypothetical protein